MKLEINVDESMFKDVLENELKAFNKDELHLILRDCIAEFFKNDDNIKKMFLEEKSSYWGGQNHFEGYEPTGLLNQIVKENFDYKEPYDEVKEALISYCKKDGTLKALMQDMIIKSFQEAFTKCFWRDGDLRGTIAGIVSEEIHGMKNTGEL